MERMLPTIIKRKSVRNFVKGEVSKNQLLQMVKAGMAAPSARNRQPWEFIMVTDREILDKLAEGLPYAKMLYDAYAAIVVCGDLNEKKYHNPEPYWVQDCSAATQNILLEAEYIGLGAVWTAVFPRKERILIVRENLLLPEHIVPLNVIPVGIPSGKDKPKDKFNPQKVHWQAWNGK